MRVRQLRISSFRGWRCLTLRPGRHALVVGEPRAGRSDLVEALRRVLDPDSTRNPPSEFDVYLGTSLEQPSGNDCEPGTAEADHDGGRPATTDDSAEIDIRIAQVE